MRILARVFAWSWNASDRFLDMINGAKGLDWLRNASDRFLDMINEEVDKGKNKQKK